MQVKADEGKRNQFVDIMRGLAMLLVVFQHTMSVSTTGAETSFVFNIAWSLQMPLFILISGYVTKYSHKICNVKDLWKYVQRRTLAYMFPWLIWTFLVRGIVFGNKGFLDIKTLLWHMDSGYWFLATIWTISMVFGIAFFLAECIEKVNKQFVLFSSYLLGMVILLGIGIIMGISFFAIKLTLYYMTFYYAGYLYAQIDNKLLSSEKGKKVIDSCVGICLAIWLFVILRFSVYEMSDSVIGILLRAVTSLTGCIAICGLCKELFSTKIGGVLAWIGEHSLEVYLMHYLLLSPMRLENRPDIYSMVGMNLVLVNYIITVVLTIVSIMAINKNKALNFALFGKQN